MKFLRNLLATILGVFIAFGLIFLFFIAIGAAFSDKDKVVIKENTILELDLTAKIKDNYNVNNPLSKFVEDEGGVLELHKILNAIDNAKNDDKIKGISINTLYVNAGMAQLQEIRNKLNEFKESGKFITAYADNYGQGTYYLSSVADSVYVNPIGGVNLKGLGTELLFFKDFEDKYGVKMEVIRHGKYKSAVEPFIANKMSDANREQLTELLNSIWDTFKTNIAKGRNKTTDEINKIADELLGRNATLAIQNNLVNDTIYKDQYDALLKKELGVKNDKKLNLVSLSKYIKLGKGRKKVSVKIKDKIAVVYALGEIKYGKGDENYIGQESIINALRKAVKNKKVKAIVLRVNSPGGSALASDLIWRELELTKKEKPVVVSMGNYAASGGYYISCNADKIFAEPTTITGSIGVFGMVPNFSEFTNRIGINSEQVQTNKHSISYSPFKPITEDFKKVTQEGIEQIYNVFLSRVAKGRKITTQQVNEIAQGRVWSGVQAKEIGLVDELGNLDDAIAYAASLVDIEKYKIITLPKYKKDFGDMFKNSPFLKMQTKNLIANEIGAENYKILKKFKAMSELKGIQARMPFILEIK